MDVYSCVTDFSIIDEMSVVLRISYFYIFGLEFVVYRNFFKEFITISDQCLFYRDYHISRHTGYDLHNVHFLVFILL
jgi:hypothetical protein